VGATLLAALLAGAAPAPAATTGDVLVRFAPGTPAGDRAAARTAAGTRLVDVLPRAGVQVVTPRAGRGAAATAAALDRRREVVFAEPDRVRRAQAVPPDPRFPEQWGLATIGAPGAWDATFGSPAVRVAVLDTGVSPASPELAPNLLSGSDFVGAGDADPDDADGHGTRVAGVIAARDDGLGLVGLAPRTAVLPVRVLTADGTGADSDIVEGIDWAVANGARVINLSFAGPGWGEALHQAILRAGAQGVLVVTAAGNGAADNDASRDVSYPCNDDAPNLICVAASDTADRLAPFSSFGAVNVDLAAPGVDVLTADWFAARANPRYAEDFETAIGSRWLPTVATNPTWQQQGGDYVATAGAGSTGTGAEVYANAYLDLRRATACTLALDVTRMLSGDDILRVRLVTQDGAIQRATNFSAVADGGPARLTLPADAFAGRGDVRLTVRLISDATTSGEFVRLHGLDLDCTPGPLTHADTIAVSGTSLAAPFVSATAALVLAAGRAEGAAALRARLLGSVDPVADLAGRVATGGRLDAAAAVGAAPAASAPPPAAATPPPPPAPGARPGPPPAAGTSPAPVPGRAPTALLRAPSRLSMTALRRGLAVRARLARRGRLELWTAGRRGRRLATQPVPGDGRIHAVRLRIDRRRLAPYARRRSLRLEVRLQPAGGGPPLRSAVRVTRARR
jgi:subtilisin family serine protease